MSEAAKKELYDAGLQIRRKVAGDKYVDKALANALSDFARPMQEYVTASCWGQVWTRPGLELKTRSLLNIAMLSVLNRGEELGTHVRGALNNGCSEIEIREALLQSSVYGGAPAGMTGFKIAEKAIVEWAEENGQERPVKGNGITV